MHVYMLPSCVLSSPEAMMPLETLYVVVGHLSARSVL
jgi:hypothetical protein